MTVSELIAKIDEMMTSTAQSIVAGSCSDWVDYKARVAKLRALQDVIDLTRQPAPTPKPREEE
jgi:hypothetical protein